MWSRQLVVKWEDALPLGNGPLGAMVFGGIEREPRAAESLPEVRHLLFAGKPIEATKLADQDLMGVQAVAEGGIVAGDGSELNISNANAVTLILVAATNYRGDDPVASSERYLVRAGGPFTALHATHIADHQKLFNRVQLDLGSPDGDRLPTDERLERFRKGAAGPGLAAMYFQFGRYELMGRQ